MESKSGTEKVAPSRRARDAAWQFRPSCYEDDKTTVALWYAGTYDAVAPSIAAFARFEREVAQEAERKALERAAERISGLRSFRPGDDVHNRAIGEALRPLPRPRKHGEGGMSGHLKFGLIACTLIIGLLGYTKVIWQSGFDQGSAVALCLVASVMNDGKLATQQPACRDAGDYKTNPLWVLRRRNGASS